MIRTGDNRNRAVIKVALWIIIVGNHVDGNGGIFIGRHHIVHGNRSNRRNLNGNRCLGTGCIRIADPVNIAVSSEVPCIRGIGDRPGNRIDGCGTVQRCGNNRNRRWGKVAVHIIIIGKDIGGHRGVE